MEYGRMFIKDSMKFMQKNSFVRCESISRTEYLQTSTVFNS
jgi:hypothetical protein